MSQATPAWIEATTARLSEATPVLGKQRPLWIQEGSNSTGSGSSAYHAVQRRLRVKQRGLASSALKESRACERFSVGPFALGEPTG